MRIQTRIPRPLNVAAGGVERRNLNVTLGTFNAVSLCEVRHRLRWFTRGKHDGGGTGNDNGKEDAHRVRGSHRDRLRSWTSFRGASAGPSRAAFLSIMIANIGK